MENAYITEEKIALLEREMQQMLASLRTLSGMNLTTSTYVPKCQETLRVTQQLTTKLVQWQLLLACEAEAMDAS